MIAGIVAQGARGSGGSADLTYALLLSSIDELDPPSGLLLSGDQQVDNFDILELSGDQR